MPNSRNCLTSEIYPCFMDSWNALISYLIGMLLIRSPIKFIFNFLIAKHKGVSELSKRSRFSL